MLYFKEDLHPVLDKDVKMVCGNMPSWKTGMKNGVAVNSFMSSPMMIKPFPIPRKVDYTSLSKEELKGMLKDALKHLLNHK